METTNNYKELFDILNTENQSKKIVDILILMVCLGVIFDRKLDAIIYRKLILDNKDYAGFKLIESLKKSMDIKLMISRLYLIFMNQPIYFKYFVDLPLNIQKELIEKYPVLLKKSGFDANTSFNIFELELDKKPISKKEFELPESTNFAGKDLLPSFEKPQETEINIIKTYIEEQPNIQNNVRGVESDNLKEKNKSNHGGNRFADSEDINLIEDLKRINISPSNKFNYAGKPKVKLNSILRNGNTYPRNRQVALNALAHANYECEIYPDHATFFRRGTNVKYTEPHHLIPLAFSENFSFSLDVEENIVSLCSNCHNNLHYGEGVKVLLSFLYKSRIELLKTVGLDLSYEALLVMYNIL